MQSIDTMIEGFDLMELDGEELENSQFSAAGSGSVVLIIEGRSSYGKRIIS